jgi:hypothetical protein
MKLTGSNDSCDCLGFNSCSQCRMISFRPLRVPVEEKTYLIRFKASDLTPHLVIAASAEIHEEHVAFLRSDGKLAALYVLEIVESWSEF